MEPKGQISDTLQSDLKRLIRFIYKFKSCLTEEKINVLRLSQHCSAPKKNTERTKKKRKFTTEKFFTLFYQPERFT